MIINPFIVEMKTARCGGWTLSVSRKPASAKTTKATTHAHRTRTHTQYNRKHSAVVLLDHTAILNACTCKTLPNRTDGVHRQTRRWSVAWLETENARARAHTARGLAKNNTRQRTCVFLPLCARCVCGCVQVCRNDFRLSRRGQTGANKRAQHAKRARARTRKCVTISHTRHHHTHLKRAWRVLFVFCSN